MKSTLRSISVFIAVLSLAWQSQGQNSTPAERQNSTSAPAWLAEGQNSMSAPAWQAEGQNSTSAEGQNSTSAPAWKAEGQNSTSAPDFPPPRPLPNLALSPDVIAIISAFGIYVLFMTTFFSFGILYRRLGIIRVGGDAAVAATYSFYTGVVPDSARQLMGSASVQSCASLSPPVTLSLPPSNQSVQFHSPTESPSTVQMIRDTGPRSASYTLHSKA